MAARGRAWRGAAGDPPWGGLWRGLPHHRAPGRPPRGRRLAAPPRAAWTSRRARAAVRGRGMARRASRLRRGRAHLRRGAAALRHAKTSGRGRRLPPRDRRDPGAFRPVLFTHLPPPPRMPVNFRNEQGIALVSCVGEYPVDDLFDAVEDALALFRGVPSAGLAFDLTGSSAVQQRTTDQLHMFAEFISL